MQDLIKGYFFIIQDYVKDLIDKDKEPIIVLYFVVLTFLVMEFSIGLGLLVYLTLGIFLVHTYHISNSKTSDDAFDLVLLSTVPLMALIVLHISLFSNTHFKEVGQVSFTKCDIQYSTSAYLEKPFQGKDIQIEVNGCSPGLRTLYKVTNNSNFGEFNYYSLKCKD